MANLERTKRYLLLRALMPLIAAWLSWHIFTQPGPPQYGALVLLWFLNLGLVAYWVDQVSWFFDERGIYSRLRRTRISWDEISKAQTNGVFLRICASRRRLHLELSQFQAPSQFAKWIEERLATRGISIERI